MSETQKGICLECGKPLDNPNSIGYHWECSEIANDRSAKEADEKFPFVVVDYYESEIDRFATEKEAEEFLFRMRHSEIKRVS